MKHKNYYYVSLVCGVILLLLQAYNYWLSVTYGTPRNIASMIGVSLVAISFMVPYPDPLPKLPWQQQVKIVLGMFAMLCIGYSFASF